MSLERVYKYYLLGTDIEFDSFRACEEHYSRNRNLLFDHHTLYGWYIVRQNLNTGRKVLFELNLSNLLKYE